VAGAGETQAVKRQQRLYELESTLTVTGFPDQSCLCITKASTKPSVGCLKASGAAAAAFK
jgi:hypothetical protein